MPVPTADTIPEVEPTVAIDVLLLVHVPPETDAVNVVVLPTHKLLEPEMTGAALTVTVW